MKKYLTVIGLLLRNEIRNREAMLFSLLLPVIILVLIGHKFNMCMPA
ncbi:hypothetical protein [Ligilactobacillus sp. Marseille-Q7487]|nr:hypothetical protein [Ligilactobacillus sp. Marseille-Q7487]